MTKQRTLHLTPSSIPKVLSELIPLDQSLTERWDKEWLHYFLTENPRPFFVNHKQLTVVTNLRGKRPSEVYDATLVSVSGVEDLSTLNALCVWAHGDHLVGKRILEVGSGPGFLGKQLGKIAAAYIGIDYSRLALSIARLTSPSNCTYYHLSDLAGILVHAGTLDTMVGRFFFIHQNYRNLIWLLTLASILLKPGGLVSADFYLKNPAISQGIVHSAHDDLDEQYPSCGFDYTISDIEQAARETGYLIESVTDNRNLQRRFVHFINTGA